MNSALMDNGMSSKDYYNLDFSVRYGVNW